MVDYTDFTAEIASHLGGITQILTNLQRIIDALPDKRDNSDILKSLSGVKSDLENIVSYVTKEDIATGMCRAKCSQMSIAVDAINEILAVLDKDDLVAAVKKLKQWDITKNITLFKEIDDAHIKWGDNPVKVEDLKEVVDYAKRRNKSYAFWSGWKSKTAIIVAIILGVLMYAEKIVKLVETLKNLIGG